MEKYVRRALKKCSDIAEMVSCLSVSLWKSALFACFLLFLNSGVFALVEQNAELPDSLFLGSKFYLNIRANINLDDAIVPDTLTKFKVLDRQKIKGSKNTEGLKLLIAAMDTGVHTFPSLVLKSAATAKDTLRTRPLTLMIFETRSPEDSILVDIAPVQKVRGELPVWAYSVILIVFILAVAAVLLLLIRKYRKRRTLAPKVEPVIVDTRTNREKTLEALNELMGLQLPLKGEFIAFHYRLSEIMKLHMEAEYGFPANEMTTREIRQYFRSRQGETVPQQDKLIPWLEECDRIKFAKHKTDINESDAKMDWFTGWLMRQNDVTPQTAVGEEQ